MARPLRARATVRSYQSRQRRLQPAARGSSRRMGSARRPEHRRRPGRSGRGARAPKPLGKDEPFACWSAPSCTSSTPRPDKTLAGVANFLSDPRRPIETTLRAMMTTRASRRRRRPSRRRQCGARATEQERERTLGCAFHRDVVSRPLSRSGGRRGDAAMRLAHPRSCRGRTPHNALSRRAAIRHQPHEAARASGPQSDRPALDREARRRAAGGNACC